MLCSRLLFFAVRATSKIVLNQSYNVNLPKLISTPFLSSKNYSTLFGAQGLDAKCRLLNNQNILQISNDINSRSVTKFSIRKGKRKSVRTVLKRFLRLHWGGWIRTIAGRHRKLYQKSYKHRERLKQHVLCNATQSNLLNKMVGPYWRKPRYYVDDPYEPYHSREEFMYTARKPKPYYPPEN